MNKTLLLLVFLGAFFSPSYMHAQTSKRGVDSTHESDIAIRCAASNNYIDSFEVLLAISKRNIIKQVLTPNTIRMPLSEIYTTETFNKAFIKGRVFEVQSVNTKDYLSEIFIDRTQGKGEIFTEYSLTTHPEKHERIYTKLMDCKVATPKL